MGLDSLFNNILTGLRLQLGGSNVSASVWSLGRGSVSENEFQNSQLHKFTKTYAGEYQQERISETLRKVTARSHFDEAVKRVNQQRVANVNYIDNQISILKNFKLPTPQFTRVGVLQRSVADIVAGKKPRGSGAGGIHVANQLQRYYQRNSEIEFFKQQQKAVQIEIQGHVANLLNQRGLITSRTFDF